MKTINFTDAEWAKLASIFSGESPEDKELVEKFNANDTYMTREKWQEIGRINDNNKIDTDKAWNKVSLLIDNNVSEAKPAQIKRLSVYKYAAVILLLISVTTVYLIKNDVFSNNIIVSTNADQKNILITLPDGSNINLNRNSTLTYAKDFGKTQRHIAFTGEAFFEITADELNPFTIDAGKATIKVVGTSFNVIAYSKTNDVEVFVKTGKVILSGLNNDVSIELDQGFVGKIDSDKTEKTMNENPNYLSWQTDFLTYNNETLDIVFSDLKRVHDMNITLDDKSILENRWTSQIDNQSKETIIQLICISFNLNYTHDGNNYHLVKK
jgi:ferric-dicitrate binding protein FerR (iron transport regulator)